MTRPVKNVLLFLTDQQRKDSIGAYGNRIILTAKPQEGKKLEWPELRRARGKRSTQE